MNSIPENYLRLMSPRERKAMGKKTAAETLEAGHAVTEKQLQAQIVQYLNLRGIWHDVDSMAHRRRGTKGAPDFQFPYNGFYVAWEVKTSAGRLSGEQVGTGVRIIHQGGEWHLIRSLAEAKAHLDRLDASLTTRQNAVSGAAGWPRRRFVGRKGSEYRRGRNPQHPERGCQQDGGDPGSEVGFEEGGHF